MDGPNVHDAGVRPLTELLEMDDSRVATNSVIPREAIGEMPQAPPRP